MSVFEDNWDYSRDKSYIEKSYLEFETHIINLLSIIENGLKTQTFLYTHSGIENQDDELKTLIENNQELRQEKDKKIKETSLLVAQYEKLKKDQKLLKREIKKTHEAFLMAKKYYKKYLKMYYTIESRDDENHTVFVQFFTEAKKNSTNFSVCLLRNINTGHCQIVSITPKLASTVELQRKLQESNDVAGALCYIRKAFMELSTKRKILFHNT